MRAVIPTAVVAALIAVAPAAATTSTSTTTASVVDTKSWCKAVIDANTRAGTMKNKRFLAPDKITPAVWKKVVDRPAQRQQVHRARAELDQDGRQASDGVLQTHQGQPLLEDTPLAPMTLADVKKITDFERTQCGITFTT